MTQAFFWGFVAAFSLVLGGLVASVMPLPRRILGMIMGFGAGVLFSAVAYEMVFEAVHLAGGSGHAAAGLFVGALTFFFAEQFIDGLSRGRTGDAGADHQTNLAIPLVLAIVLDGVPESVIIGLGILKGGSVSLAMLAAVFISNLPESIVSTKEMSLSGWNRPRIFGLWLGIALVCGLASMLGYVAFGGASPSTLSFVHAFTGGAVLMMLSNTMIPEAYERGGKLAGVFTTLGFSVSVGIIVLEKASG